MSIKRIYGGALLAQLLECVTLDLGLFEPHTRGRVNRRGGGGREREDESRCTCPYTVMKYKPMCPYGFVSKSYC